MSENFDIAMQATDHGKVHVIGNACGTDVNFEISTDHALQVAGALTSTVARVFEKQAEASGQETEVIQ